MTVKANSLMCCEDGFRFLHPFSSFTKSKITCSYLKHISNVCINFLTFISFTIIVNVEWTSYLKKECNGTSNAQFMFALAMQIRIKFTSWKSIWIRGSMGNYIFWLEWEFNILLISVLWRHSCENHKAPLQT